MPERQGGGGGKGSGKGGGEGCAETDGEGGKKGGREGEAGPATNEKGSSRGGAVVINNCHSSPHTTIYTNNNSRIY